MHDRHIRKLNVSCCTVALGKRPDSYSNSLRFRAVNANQLIEQGFVLRVQSYAGAVIFRRFHDDTLSPPSRVVNVYFPLPPKAAAVEPLRARTTQPVRSGLGTSLAWRFAWQNADRLA